MIVVYHLLSSVVLIFLSYEEFEKVEYVIFDTAFNWTYYLQQIFNILDRKNNDKMYGRLLEQPVSAEG